jgi:hypothetical protein
VGVVGHRQRVDARTKEQRLTDFLRYGPKPSTAPPRARSILQAYLVANKLSQQILLTYENLTPEPINDLRALMKRSRRINGRHPWIAVPEFGAHRRLHFHVGLPQEVNASEFNAGWKHGMTDIVLLRTVTDLKRYCGYLGKGFAEPRGARPHNHRYISAPGYMPEWIDYGYATRQDAEILAQQQAGEHWMSVRRWESASDWCAGGFEWETDPLYPGGLVEDDESFFRRVGATQCEHL